MNCYEDSNCNEIRLLETAYFTFQFYWLFKYISRNQWQHIYTLQVVSEEIIYC